MTTEIKRQWLVFFDKPELIAELDRKMDNIEALQAKVNKLELDLEYVKGQRKQLLKDMEKLSAICNLLNEYYERQRSRAQ